MVSPENKNFRAKPFNTLNKGEKMIELTRLDKRKSEKFILNCELIETIEEKPDTTIRLNNGRTYVVVESSSQVVSKILAYKRNIFSR
jgi:flagellar protein FlbD